MAEAGVISIRNKPVFNGVSGLFVTPESRNVGMVFQSYAIWPHMTVLQNVSFPAEMRGLKNPKELAHAALKTVELDQFHDRPATRLSGGQQQRVALARAIVGRPDVLLLDEPLSNLDASLREQMRGELRRLQSELGLTTILVTHDQAEALSMSDRIAIMDKGSIIEIGTPEELYADPQSSFTARFIGDSVQIPALQSAHGSNSMVIQTVLGQHIVPSESHPDDRPGVFLRTDRVKIHRARPALDFVKATITARRFLGSGYEYDVRVDGTPPVILRLKAQDDAALADASDVFLEIPKDAIYVV